MLYSAAFGFFIPVLFELCFCRWHVLQTARTVMGIHLNSQIMVFRNEKSLDPLLKVDSTLISLV